jgi:hypothetical protein
MNGDFGMRRWAVVVLAILAAVAIGTAAYQAGVSRGIALQPPVAAAPPAAGAPAVVPPPYPYYPYGYGYYRPWHFGFFGPLLFVFFWIFLFRAIFWAGGGWRRRWRGGDRDYWPQRFDEWHRRAHERMGGEPAPPAGQA